MVLVGDVINCQKVEFSLITGLKYPHFKKNFSLRQKGKNTG